MGLLWSEISRQAELSALAMAWHVEQGEEHHATSAKSVRHAGFAGHVSEGPEDDYTDGSGGGWDDNLWEDSTPDPTPEEEAHHEEHGEYPESFDDRHSEEYHNRLHEKAQEDEPDHEDPDLMLFVGNHGTNTAHWKQHATYGHVHLRQPVYATQSHVAQSHIDKYHHDPGAQSNHREKYPNSGGSDYLGDGAPMFVTHEGRLHTTEGHHRVAAALQRGDDHIMGWHYDADKHGFPDQDGHMPGHPDYESYEG